MIFRHQTPPIDRRCGLHRGTRFRLLPCASSQADRSGSLRQSGGGTKVLREYLAEFPGYSLVAANFQPAGKISPRAAELVNANGNPILVFGDNIDAGIRDFSCSHFVGPIVYLDPPFATVRSA